MRHAKEKTDLVWNLTQEAKFIFLSRPRRFGKSLLTTTLVSYFKGQKELFEGLKITELEKEWERYPVIHLDMSAARGKETSAELQRALKLQMKHFRTDTTYVFELKVNGTAQEALDQINGKGYALPYETEGRRVVKVGVQYFD